MKSEKINKNRQLKDFLKQTSFSLQTVILLSFTTIWLIFFIALTPDQLDWEVGTVATKDLQADQSVTYEDKVATKQKQDKALESFEDVYHLDMGRFNELTLVAIDNIFDQFIWIINEAQKQEGLNGLQDGQVKNQVDRLGLSFTPEEWQTLLQFDNNKISKLHSQTVVLVSAVMGAGVKEKDIEKGKEKIFNDIKDTNAFSVLDKKLLQQLLARVHFYPTLTKDRALTDEKRKEIINGVEPVWRTIQKGSLIVGRGDTITTNQYEAMKALGYTNDRSVSLIGLGVFAFILVFYLTIYFYLKRFYDNRANLERDFKLMLLILTFTTILAAVVFSMRIGDTTVVMKQVGYLMPLAAGAMLTAVLIGAKEAVFLLMISTMMTAVYSQDVAIVVVNMLGGIAGISQTRRLNRRLDLGWAAFYIALIMCIGIVGLGLVYGYSLKVIFLGVAYAIGNGFVSVVLTLGLLPYFEVGFDITTSMSLLELGDPSNKLLKRLMLEAPGTYHHSIMVANLAEAAADAIGADPLLVRTGAYYHDIGKLRRPVFFAENQFNNEDPHGKISPMLSTLIITAHIKDGVQLAKEARLPDSIVDLIAQHHGDTMVQYFYNEAKKQNPEVKESDFRYHQKKPQTREAAVLMMADSVEAAVRSARSKLTAGQTEGFIRQLIRNKQKDGQFTECDLTFKDLDTIANTFHVVLSGFYHKRIEYPDSSQLRVGKQGG